NVVTANGLALGAATGLKNGEAVRYGNGGGSNVGGVMDGEGYYVVGGKTTMTIKVQRKRGGLDSNKISLKPPQQGMDHTLTPVTQFLNVANLNGGNAADTFTLRAGGSLTGAINGGDGDNTLLGPDANTVWTISGLDTGSVATADQPNTTLVSFL